MGKWSGVRLALPMQPPYFLAQISSTTPSPPFWYKLVSASCKKITLPKVKKIAILWLIPQTDHPAVCSAISVKWRRCTSGGAAIMYEVDKKFHQTGEAIRLVVQTWDLCKKTRGGCYGELCFTYFSISRHCPSAWGELTLSFTPLIRYFMFHTCQCPSKVNWRYLSHLF